MIYYVVYYFISIMIQHVIHCTLYDITTQYCIVKVLIGETLLENLQIRQYPNLYLKFLWHKIQSFPSNIVYEIVKVIPIRIFYYMIIPSHNNVDQL